MSCLSFFMRILRRVFVCFRKSQLNFCLFYHTLLVLFYAKCFGVVIGSDFKCFGPCIIDVVPQTLRIGSDVTVVSNSLRCTATTIYAPTKFRTFSSSALIDIGNGVGMNGLSITARSRTIKIGDNTMIAPNCTIVDSDFHALWPVEGRLTNPAIENDADVIIGENCWIGMQSIILKGVHIGNGSVIAAGSVVTSSIPENVLAGGVPARIIRSLVPLPS